MSRSDEEIWYWYQKTELFKDSHMPCAEWCKINNVEIKKFTNMLFRICWKSRTEPEIYEKILPILRQCQESNLSTPKFCKTFNHPINMIREGMTHLRYIDSIANIKKNKNSMQFIKVPLQVITSIASPSFGSELIEKQNDLEIIISKGVKVSISPNIDSMKIIKIIELLKDL